MRALRVRVSTLGVHEQGAGRSVPIDRSSSQYTSCMDDLPGHTLERQPGPALFA